MKQKLCSIFESCKDLSAVRKLLEEPKIILGSFSVIGGKAPSVWQDIAANGSVYRWDTKQGAKVHILPYYIAKKLMEGSDIPLELPAGYRDKRRMESMKRGELALIIERKSGTVAVMMKTETAFLLQDLQEKRNKMMEAALTAISNLKPGDKFTAEITADGIKIKSTGKQKTSRFSFPGLEPTH